MRGESANKSRRGIDRRLMLGSLASLVVTPFATAEEPSPAEWLDEQVLLKAPPFRLYEGDRVVVETRSEHVWTVEFIRGPWLWLVGDDDMEGWALAENCVLLSQATGYFDERLKSDPSNPLWLRRRAFSWKAKNQWEKAIADFDAALRLSPLDHLAMNGKAFLFATCPESRFRDGKQALTLARRACERTGWKEAGPLDTLAAAYAEIGDFPQAVAAEQKALALLSGPDARPLERRLALYQRGQPYRGRY